MQLLALTSGVLSSYPLLLVFFTCNEGSPGTACAKNGADGYATGEVVVAACVYHIIQSVLDSLFLKCAEFFKKTNLRELPE